MAKWTRTVVIEAPVEEVFDVARDVGALLTCNPTTAVRDVRLTPDGVGSRAEWFSHFRCLHIQGVVEYVEVVANERIGAHSSTGPDFTLTFEPVDGGTAFTFATEWEPEAEALQAIGDLMFQATEREMNGWVDGMKSLVEGGPAPAEVPPPRARAAHAEAAVTIDAPVQDVYTFATDLGRLWSAHPQLAVRGVRSTPDVVGSSAHWFTHVARVLHMDGTIEVVDAVPGERIVIQSSLGPVWTFTFEPDDGGTRVTGDVAVRLGMLPLLGGPLQAAMARGYRTFLVQVLGAVKEQIERGPVPVAAGAGAAAAG